MKQLLPLVVSVITIFQMWQVGNLKVWAWVIGIANQALWFVMIVVFGIPGLLLLNAFMVVTYARNLVKWTVDSIDAGADRLTVGSRYL